MPRPVAMSSGCEQRCVGGLLQSWAASGCLAGTHRQHRLIAVQRLNLGLLTQAENDGMLRRRDASHDALLRTSGSVRQLMMVAEVHRRVAQVSPSMDS